MGVVPLMAGAREGGFEIMRRLGARAGTTSFVAVETSTGRRVVVKELSLQETSTWNDVEAFVREGAILRRAAHPAIPALIAEFDRSGGACLVREYAPGFTLGDWVRAGKRFRESRVRDVVRQVLEAAAYLEEQTPSMRLATVTPDTVLLHSSSRVSVTGEFSDVAASETNFESLGRLAVYALTGELRHLGPSDDVSEPFRAWLACLGGDGSDGARFVSAREALDALLAPEGTAARRAPRRLFSPAVLAGIASACTVGHLAFAVTLLRRWMWT